MHRELERKTKNKNKKKYYVSLLMMLKSVIYMSNTSHTHVYIKVTYLLSVHCILKGL